MLPPLPGAVLRSEAADDADVLREEGGGGAGRVTASFDAVGR